MWPEDIDNDYSYMNLRKQYEENAKAQKNDTASKFAKAGIGAILKMIM